VAIVSAFSYPYGNRIFGGFEMILAVIRVIIEAAMSVEESIPSATTARLPDMIPRIILVSANMALAQTLIQEA
jgi:hypothetical protein